ncbi:DUF305 domain-containing protein [Telluribacter humicola]|uniref:DUF305 domain-containing protein n=1 Tax=Telluribacter humicola TaxID=1720261 RepID=UPI001A9646E7|nr:DUF305 domain-containing protein [Telluribacter humicola]
MIKRIFSLSAALLVSAGLLVRCKNEQDLSLMDHDESELMRISHANMEQMHMMKPTGDPDYDFAMMMKMHHQGAIETSQEQLKSGTNQEMRDFAQKVIDDQQAEIDLFNQWLQSHSPLPEEDAAAFRQKSMMAMEKMEKAQDIRILTGRTDIDYAQLMIDHHQSALETSSAVIEHGDDPEIKEMATKIIQSQQEEISQLQEWLISNKTF